MVFDPGFIQTLMKNLLLCQSPHWLMWRETEVTVSTLQQCPVQERRGTLGSFNMGEWGWWPEEEALGSFRG